MDKPSISWHGDEYYPSNETKKRLNEICGLSQTSNNLNKEKVRLKLTALFVKIKIVITSHDEIVCRFLPSNLHLMN